MKILMRCLVYASVLSIVINAAFANHSINNAHWMDHELMTLEVSSGGRLSVFAVDTGNNRTLQFHARKPFPMCSTAKVMVVAAILKYAMQDSQFLQEKVRYTQAEIATAGYTPITKKHLGDGMTIAGLCDAAITESDNGAMNLLMRKLGGPAAVTSFAHGIGDRQFRLERFEPELNSAIPGDLRDTSTAEAMAKSLKRLLLGDDLSEIHRRQLLHWLKTNKTGNKRIRAGVPKGWVVGDKTGTGDYGTSNDIGIIFPPHGDPIILVIYFTQNTRLAAPREDVIASATRIILRSHIPQQNHK